VKAFISDPATAPETEASDDECNAILRKGELCRMKPDASALTAIAADDLTDYAGTIVGGGPGCVSDALRDKTATDARRNLSLMPPQITAEPAFVGVLLWHRHPRPSPRCYGFKGPLRRSRECDDLHRDAGRLDPLLDGFPTVRYCRPQRDRLLSRRCHSCCPAMFAVSR
jgi:GMP synthase (glutamine-hydrolysing)